MRWNDPKLNKLAGDFFRLFSRFEYALKANGYLVPNRNDATPDWERFATEIHDAFSHLEDGDVKKAVAFLLAEPPKKQVNKDGQIEWDLSPPRSKNETHLVLLYVRRVRNNLFHGGKFNGKWFAPERSGPLIEASVKILRACLGLSSGVCEAYSS